MSAPPLRHQLLGALGCFQALAQVGVHHLLQVVDVVQKNVVDS